MYVPLVRSTGHSALHIYIKRTFSTLTAKAVSCVEPILILFFIQFHHYPFLSQPSVEMPISQICLSHPSPVLAFARGRGAALATRQTRGLPRGEKSACGFDRADYDGGTAGALAVRGGAWPWTRRHVGENRAPPVVAPFRATRQPRAVGPEPRGYAAGACGATHKAHGVDGAWL